MLVAVVPVAGHVGPVSGLVAELVERGHHVRVYTGSSYQARFRSLGAAVIPWRAAQDFDENDLGATFPLARRGGMLSQIALVRDGFIGTAPGQVRDLGGELAREPADVLVADSMSFGGALAAERHALPWAVVNVLPFNQSFDEPVPPGFRVRPARSRLGRQRDRLLWTAYDLLTSPFTRAYDRAREDVGLPPDPRPYGSVLTSSWLTLATGCPSLDVARPDLPTQVHFIGSISPAGLAAPPPAELEPGRPVVVVTQGTHDVEPADLLEPALQALGDLDVDVIATTGRRGAGSGGVTPPPNARLAELIDFASVLPKASVLVTNGGWGGVLAGLASGVPLVVAPRGAPDKPEIAARVERAGVGINLGRRRPRPRAIADAVREVLTRPSYAARAHEIKVELDQLGGARTAAALLERLAAQKAPVRRSCVP